MNEPAVCTVIGAADVVDDVDDVEEELADDDVECVVGTDEDVDEEPLDEEGLVDDVDREV